VIPGDSNPSSVVEPFDHSPRDKMLKHPDSLVPYHQPEIKKDHADPGCPSLVRDFWLCLVQYKCLRKFELFH